MRSESKDLGEAATTISHFSHRPIYTPRRFYILMRHTTPALPSEPVEPAEPISYVIKGRPAPWTNPEP